MGRLTGAESEALALFFLLQMVFVVVECRCKSLRDLLREGICRFATYISGNIMIPTKSTSTSPSLSSRASHAVCMSSNSSQHAIGITLSKQERKQMRRRFMFLKHAVCFSYITLLGKRGV